MSTKTCDVVVLGVGGMGSAAVYHLARRGYDVVGIEQYDIPHSNGSSHGISRIIRLPQYEDPAYVPLVRRAFELWKALDNTHDRQLLHQIGSVDIGLNNDRSPYTGSKRACEDHAINHEDLSGSELNERFPAYEFPLEYRAVFQSDGGFLHCEQCTVAHVNAAHEHGATVRARESVQEWEANDTGVTVRTDCATYEANKLVVTAGAWTAQLIPSLSHLLQPERQVLGWFQPISPEKFSPENFPVFVAEVKEGHFYGFPTYEIPGFKIGKFNHQHETGKPEDLDSEPDTTDESILRDFVKRYFPEANGPVMRLSTCMFTNTPDEAFLLDTLPQSDRVVIGAGFSGHGFKFASVIGEILADLAIDAQTTHPIDFLQLDRFE